MTEFSPTFGDASVSRLRPLDNREVLPRKDRFVIHKFTEESDPLSARIAQQVHAVGYKDMGFVNDKAITDEGILAEDIDKARGDDVDYALALDPVSDGKYATLRIKSVPSGKDFTYLPAFGLTKDSLTDDGLHELMEATTVKELAALARTPESSQLMVFELLRDAIQEAQGKNELWFFSIVSTTFDSIQYQYGKRALRQIGEPVGFDDERISKDITLTPALFDVDTFFDSVAEEAMHETDARHQKILHRTLMFYTEGIGDAELSDKVRDMRAHIIASMQPKGA